jgi:hypothetical protein
MSEEIIFFGPSLKAFTFSTKTKNWGKINIDKT